MTMATTLRLLPTGVETGTDTDLQVKLSSSMFAAFDSAFADSEDDAWSEL